MSVTVSVTVLKIGTLNTILAGPEGWVCPKTPCGSSGGTWLVHNRWGVVGMIERSGVLAYPVSGRNVGKTTPSKGSNLPRT